MIEFYHMGYLLALLNGLLESIRVVLSKVSLRNVDEYFVAWIIRVVGLLVLIPVVDWKNIPSLNQTYWLAAALIAILSSLSTVLYMKSVKVADISLVSPLTAFSPLFILLTSPLIIGEFPNRSGLIGVGLIVVGSYVLHLKKQSTWLMPIKSMITNRGSKLMIIVALIWSLEVNVHKIGVQNSSVMFWTLTHFIGSALVLLPFVIAHLKNFGKYVHRSWVILLILGVITGLSQVTQMESLKLILVAYSIAIKRTSILFTIIFGWWLFKETEIKKRLASAAIMILGVLLISFYG